MRGAGGRQRKAFQSGEEGETLRQLFPQRKTRKPSPQLLTGSGRRHCSRATPPEKSSGCKSEQAFNQEAADVIQTRACADVILINLSVKLRPPLHFLLSGVFFVYVTDHLSHKNKALQSYI